MYLIPELYDLSHTQAEQYLSAFTDPWEALDGIAEMVVSVGATLCDDYIEISPKVWVHTTAVVAPTAFLGGPCVIGALTQVRHGAFIRGSALIGRDCVVGNSTEIKNAILFDGVQVPHYNYIGDSILGYKAHFGAGAITSNIKSDKSLVVIDGKRTGRRKVGAMVGDLAEIGCNAVLNPGVVIGRRSVIYPVSCVRGIVPADHIYKTGSVIVARV